MPRAKATDLQRKRVQILASRGLNNSQIQRDLGIRSEKSLIQNFQKELMDGRAFLSLSLHKAEFEMAISGKHPRATIRFLERYGEWSESMGPENFITELHKPWKHLWFLHVEHGPNKPDAIEPDDEYVDED